MKESVVEYGSDLKDFNFETTKDGNFWTCELSSEYKVSVEFKLRVSGDFEFVSDRQFVLSS